MIFKSRQVNLDKEPYRNGLGERAATIDSLPHDERIWFNWAPRPEFEPTRDPQPYAHRAYGDRCEFPLNSFVWAPRREQFDTPVNRVLEAFRKGFPTGDKYEVLLNLESQWAARFTPDEIDHARRVLTRLANWKGQ